ncbi:MAG: hypothetical protein RRA15_03465 [bacterium]|nr:hypothetical protein [bacterium]MDT8365533.1 hypothetical protein [bacterium]
MKAEEFAEVFMIDIQQAHLILGYLLQLNLFQRTIGEGYQLDNYILNPAFFAPVTATLESMNILY